jgi:hypothetical protein
MPRYVIADGRRSYYVFSTVVMDDISGNRTRNDIARFLREYGMTAEEAEDMIQEGENRRLEETRRLLEPMVKLHHEKAVKDHSEQRARPPLRPFQS